MQLNHKKAKRIYLILVIVPGCVLTASLQSLLGSGSFPHALRGIAITLLPFVLAAAYLLYLTEPPNAVAGRKRLSSMHLWNMLLITIFLLAIGYTVLSTMSLTEVDGGRGNICPTEPEGGYGCLSQLLSLWSSGCVSGLLVFNFGLYVLLKRRDLDRNME